MAQSFMHASAIPVAATLSRRDAISALLALTLLPSVAADAARVPRLGVLSLDINASSLAVVPELRDGLAGLGWVEGRTLTIDWRTAAGRLETLEPLSQELVALPCDVLFVGGPGPLEVLRRRTKTVPIVAVSGSDPVKEGWGIYVSIGGGVWVSIRAVDKPPVLEGKASSGVPCSWCAALSSN